MTEPIDGLGDDVGPVTECAGVITGGLRGEAPREELCGPRDRAAGSPGTGPGPHPVGSAGSQGDTTGFRCSLSSQLPPNTPAAPTMWSCDHSPRFVLGDGLFPPNSLGGGFSEERPQQADGCAGGWSLSGPGRPCFPWAPPPHLGEPVPPSAPCPLGVRLHRVPASGSGFTPEEVVSPRALVTRAQASGSGGPFVATDPPKNPLPN